MARGAAAVSLGALATWTLQSHVLRAALARPAGPLAGVAALIFLPVLAAAPFVLVAIALTLGAGQRRRGTH